MSNSAGLAVRDGDNLAEVVKARGRLSNLFEKTDGGGYTFYSETDTEVVIKLVDYYCKKYNMVPIDAMLA